jgi:hypothetical protein
MDDRIPGSSDTRQRRQAERPITLGARNTIKLIGEAAKIALAREAGTDQVGYMARLLIQATLPHSRPTGLVYRRTNGNLTVELRGHENHGLPYGVHPRLALSWMATEAVRTKSRELYPGDTLASFLAKLGLASTGGKKGTITAFKRQFEKLFRSSIAWSHHGDGRCLDVQLFPIEAREMWWDPHSPEQRDLFQSRIVLNTPFFEELVAHPVPINMAALRELARERSPLAIDLYMWLTHRMSYLREEQDISWASLELQFGADYADRHDFRRAFLEKLRRVKRLYPEAKVAPSPGGLTLWPSPPHVASRRDRIR